LLDKVIAPLLNVNPLGIDTALELIVKASPLASPSVAPPLAEKAPEADRVPKLALFPA